MDKVCEKMLEKLENKEMCLMAVEDNLPKSYLQDMKDLFESDPETDTISKVYWSDDIECYYSNGVITHIANLPIEDVLERIRKYAKDKNIMWLNLLYKNPDGCYMTKHYELSDDEFYDEEEVLINYDGSTTDGFLNIDVYFWGKTEPSLKK